MTTPAAAPDATPATTPEPARRILIIDDHPLFRRGLSQLIALDPGLELVGEASAGDEGIGLARQLDPDLILLDLNMKGIDGIATLRLMRDKGIEARVVMLTVSDNADDLVAAIRAGADGYLLKDMEPEDLLTSIQNAFSGRMVLSERLSTLLALAIRSESLAASRDSASLTERERAILACLAGGLSNKLIGRELNIAEGTVKVHVKNLLRKLNFRSRVEAAVWAVESGIKA
jgi:two-component system nitrate/nitrite response regulator NarL